MYTTYNIFKFLHVSAVVVWIGGIVAVAVLNARLAREKDRAVSQAAARQSGFFGARIIGPAAGITLMAGIVMMIAGQMGVPFWIWWGFGVMILSMGLGGTVLRRTGEKLGDLLASAELDDPAVKSLQRRMNLLTVVNVVLLFSAVWAMVFKPNF